MQFRRLPDTRPVHLETPAQVSPRRSVRSVRSARPAPTHLLLEALEDRTLLSFSPAVSYAAGPYPLAVATADFNNDDVQDVAVANYSGSSVSVLLGNPNGTLQAAQNVPTGYNPISVAVGDFDDDGNMDIATANAGGWDASVLMGNGDGTFDPAASLGLGMSPASVAVGDFNGDGNMDLGVTTNYYTYGGGWYYWYPGYYTSYANVLLGNGDGSFAAPNSTWMGDGYHTSAAVADFNGDDIDDFATVNFDYWSVSVLLGDASGFLQWSAELFAGYYPYAVAAADLDGDEDADLVTANLYGNDVGVLRGDGAGGFAGPESYATGHAPAAAVLGDFTKDGRVDIATANGWDGTVSVLRGTSDGGFAAPAISAAGPGTWGIAAADFNGDLWLDAVTANSDANNVSVLLNTQDWRSFQVSYPLSVVVGETHTVTVTALDNNGDVITDYAGTVHFSSSDPLAGLPDDYAFAPADNGTKTFSVTLNTVGTQSIGVNDTATPHFGGQQVNIYVNPPPPALLSIDNVVVTETDSGTVLATFTVTRGGNLDNTVTVNFGTSDGGARAGSDYVGTSGALTFGPNEPSKEITVEVNGDVTDEYDQSFYVSLWDVSVGGQIVDGWGEGMILDNDAAPTMTITALVSKNEGKKNQLTSFDFIVSLSAPSEKDIWVNYATANGTATTADGDYIAKSNTLYIAPGQTSGTITVQARGDNRKESDETFSVTLSGAVNADILAALGIGEILDDDATPRGKGKP